MNNNIIKSYPAHRNAMKRKTAIKSKVSVGDAPSNSID